jgi:hypothetical protein
VRRSAPEIYGGAFKNDSSLTGRHADAMSSAHGLGYFYQLLAMAGWSSLPWLWTLRQPTLPILIDNRILGGVSHTGASHLVNCGATYRHFRRAARYSATEKAAPFSLIPQAILAA